MMMCRLLLSLFVLMAEFFGSSLLQRMVGLLLSLLEGGMAAILLLMIVTILGVYLIVVTSEQLSYTCAYCCRLVKDCDYEQHISSTCPDFLIECVFGCGEYITRKEMKQHCKYQCINTKQILSQQEEHEFPVNCFARQETH